MEETVDNRLMFDALDRALEAYGANTARWPKATRGKLEAFLAGNSEAQKRVTEALALDRVLSFAPRLSDADNSALAGRIVAAAARQPRAVTGPATVPTAPRWFAGRGSQGLAGAALAASLVLGIFAGQSADFETLSDALVSGAQMAQSDETDVITDEDLL
jgi:anti-sigma factor RsiW